MPEEDLVSLLKRIAPELGLEENEGYKILIEILMAVRKDAFIEAAEMAENYETWNENISKFANLLREKVGLWQIFIAPVHVLNK